jgi:amino acid adenylation domain-containing protein
VAVVDRERSLTYAELDAAANRLAHTLVDLGVTRGDRVSVYIDKSLEAVVGLYAIMKTGASYVPIDVRAPVTRAAYIVTNCGVQVAITSAGVSEAWPELASEDTTLRHLVVLDADVTDAGAGQAKTLTRADVGLRPDTPLGADVISRDLAYILYTSGSTGAPKGVKLSHRNALAYVEWAAEEFGFTSADRFSSHAPFHFDLSVLDLYASALVGATVVLVPPGTSVFPGQVVRFIESERITVWYSVPSILSMMLQRGKLEQGGFPQLRVLLFAGEVFPTKYLRQLMALLPDVAFANLYGPTETNVCTYYRVPEPPAEGSGDIPIGRAIANVHTFVVDEDGNPMEPGETGELWVRGETVMKGYWGDAAKTAERLVRHPFGDASDLAYRTGDIVRQNPAGDYEFLGRRDHQIKSRGYRIELGEIETALYGHPLIEECAVIPIPDDLVTNLIKAYVVAREPVEEHELKHFCRERVPPYMVPDMIEFVPGLPKTSTGKIDRNLLSNRPVPK